MTPEIAKRVEFAHKVAKLLSGPARRLTEMRSSVWHPEQFDAEEQAAAAGKLFSYIEGIPFAGHLVGVPCRRNLLTNEWFSTAFSDIDGEQIKQAYAAEIARVQKLLQKAS